MTTSAPLQILAAGHSSRSLARLDIDCERALELGGHRAPGSLGDPLDRFDR